MTQRSLHTISPFYRYFLHEMNTKHLSNIANTNIQRNIATKQTTKYQVLIPTQVKCLPCLLAEFNAFSGCFMCLILFTELSIFQAKANHQVLKALKTMSLTAKKSFPRHVKHKQFLVSALCEGGMKTMSKISLL